MWFLYILLCDQKIFYVGITDNLKRRISQHKNGYSKYTHKFSDIKFVYYEEQKTLADAMRRERQIKRWSSAKKIALIKGDIELLKKLSRGHGHFG